MLLWLVFLSLFFSKISYCLQSSKWCRLRNYSVVKTEFLNSMCLRDTKGKEGNLRQIPQTKRTVSLKKKMARVNRQLSAPTCDSGTRLSDNTGFKCRTEAQNACILREASSLLYVFPIPAFPKKRSPWCCLWVVITGVICTGWCSRNILVCVC